MPKRKFKTPFANKVIKEVERRVERSAFETNESEDEEMQENEEVQPSKEVLEERDELALVDSQQDDSNNFDAEMTQATPNVPQDQVMADEVLWYL